MKTMTGLRRALEDAEIDKQPVVIKGPLSDEFTKSLQEVYSKTPAEGTDNVATESQANDALAMQALARAIQSTVAPETEVPTVYAVDAASVTDQDVINVTNDMIAKAPTDADLNYSLVINGTTPDAMDGTGGKETTFVEDAPSGLVSALESIASHHGVKVYRSLEAYAAARYIR